jgi:phosphate starvation-inducible PhoH-like protein
MSKKSRLGKEGKTPLPDKSKFVPQDGKIDYQLQIKERQDLTPKQQELIDLILDRNTKVVFIGGPAGTSKTWCAIYAALKLLNRRTVSDILYTRTIVESASKSLGALPGELGSKIEPFMLPLHDKLNELLSVAQVNRLTKENRVQGVVVNHLRGASINAKFVVCDEAQNYTWPEMVTTITRLGEHTKMIFAGDPDQSDLIGKSSGFMKMYDLFNNEESRAQGIQCFSFTKDDIVRSGILKYICGRLDSIKKSPVEPMFPPS